MFPEIDESLCVECGLCERACGFQSLDCSESEGPFFAAAGRGDCSASASGGAFFSLARSVLQSGGVVYGAAYNRSDEGLVVRYRRVVDLDGLCHLQGSKYVQSDASDAYGSVRQDLKSSATVLFSGTPCQVAGLRGFLGSNWPNLITVDLVCHGVPSVGMFKSYVNTLEKRYGKRVVDFRFRCKRKGWGHSLLLLLLRPFGALDASQDEEVLIPASESTYYDLFLKMQTLRDKLATRVLLPAGRGLVI